MGCSGAAHRPEAVHPRRRAHSPEEPLGAVMVINLSGNDARRSVGLGRSRVEWIVCRE